MKTIINKIGEPRLTTARFFGFWAILFTLKLVDGPVLVNNDRVLLESKTFRLTYTARSSEAHKFLVVVQDNFNSTPWEQTFEFNSKDNGDEEGGATPGLIVNPGTLTPIAR